MAQVICYPYFTSHNIPFLHERKIQEAPPPGEKSYWLRLLLVADKELNSSTKCPSAVRSTQVAVSHHVGFFQRHIRVRKSPTPSLSEKITDIDAEGTIPCSRVTSTNSCSLWA